MKLLVVVPDSEPGGVTSSAVNFSTEMSKRGNEVYFLDMSAQILKRRLLPEGVQAVCLDGVSRQWNLGLWDVRKAKGFGKIGILLLGVVKKLTIRSGLWYKLIFSKFDQYGEFDVAVAFRQCDPCYTFVLHKVQAKKKIGFVHGELKCMGDISSWKRHMTAFHKIAYVSNAVKEEFVAAYPELAANACTVYNMFDVERIRRLAQEAPAVAFSNNVKNIVTVARIDNAFKQIHWIPQICAKLKEQSNTPFHWYVLGDGPDYAETVKLAEELGVTDVLTFAGNQENPFAIIKNADFTVLTSKSESYGMVVVESFILGIPVVVAQYPAIFEIMEDHKQGIIAQQNLQSISACVQEMLREHPEFLHRLNELLQGNQYTNACAYRQFWEAIHES